MPPASRSPPPCGLSAAARVLWNTSRTMPALRRSNVTQFIPLPQAVPPVRGKRASPRRRPDVALGDRGYDHDKYRRPVWDLGVKPAIARRGFDHGSGLGTGSGLRIRWGPA